MTNNTILLAMTPTSTFPTQWTNVLHKSDRNVHKYYFLISIIVVNVAIAIVASFFNFMIILTFVKKTYLRTPSNILLLGLAATDFFNAVLTEPAFCAMLGAKLTENNLLYSKLDRVWSVVILVLCPIAFCNLTLITADRFLAIYFHLRYNQFVTTLRYGMALVSIWLSCTLLSLLDTFLKSQTFIYVYFFLILLGLLLNFIFIFKITRVIRRHSKQIQSQRQATQPVMNMPRYKKSVNTVYFVIGSFVVCYSPVLLQVVIDNEDFTDVSHTILMLNGVLNPLIYCWRIEMIRNAVYRVCRREQHPQH